jgi:hypothetical protein
MHYRDIGYFEEMRRLRSPDFEDGQNTQKYQEIVYRYDNIKLIAKRASLGQEDPIEAKIEINKELGLIDKLKEELKIKS